MSDELRWCIIIGGSLVFILLVFVFFKIKFNNKKKTLSEYPELLSALGGASNISNLILNGSRISMSFDNKKNIDKDKIKENGVETIVMANKKITLVIGKKSKEIFKYLLDNVSN